MRRALLVAATTVLVTACQAPSNAPIIDSSTVVTPTESTTEPAPTPTVTAGPLTVREVESLATRMTEAMERVRTGHVTFSMGPVSMDGDFRYLSVAPSARSELSAVMGPFGPYTFHLVVVDERMYISLDGLMPPDKYFRATETDPLGDNASSQLVKLDPNVLPTTLRGAAAKLRVVGVEDLYGEPVIHYRSQASLEDVAELLGQSGIKSDVVDYDLWLDPDGLVRKVELEVGRVLMSAEYSDWGKPVRIREPGPRDLVDSPLG